MNVILISIGNSAAYLGVAFAFFVLWRLDRQHLWNLLWGLGHALLAVATLCTNVARELDFPLVEICSAYAFGAAAACLLEGARSAADRALQIRPVVLAAVLIGSVFTLIGLSDPAYNNYASAALSFLVYALIGALLLRRTGSAYRYVSLLLFLRAGVASIMPFLIIYGRTI